MELPGPLIVRTFRDGQEHVVLLHRVEEHRCYTSAEWKAGGVLFFVLAALNIWLFSAYPRLADRPFGTVLFLAMWLLPPGVLFLLRYFHTTSLRALAHDAAAFEARRLPRSVSSSLPL
jgi:hypothetical protein